MKRQKSATSTRQTSYKQYTNDKNVVKLETIAIIVVNT